MIAPLAPALLSLRRRLVDLAAQVALIALLVPVGVALVLRDRLERRTLPAPRREAGECSAWAAAAILGGAILAVGLVFAGAVVLSAGFSGK